MKAGLNDIVIQNRANNFTGKYPSFYTFSENLKAFPLFITKVWALESDR